MFLKISNRFHTVIAPGDTVNVIGEFDDKGKCDVGRENNFLIVHPDVLVSGTRVFVLYLSEFYVNLWKHVLHIVHGLNPC